MSPRITKTVQYRSIWIALCTIGLLWLGLIFNLFQWADSWLYDKLMSFPSIKQQKPPSVLLIETPLSYQYSESQDWEGIIAKLRLLKPKAIVLPSKPENWKGQAGSLVTPNIPLIFGRLEGQTSSLPATNQQPIGSILLPPIDGNLYREHWYAPVIADKEKLSLIAAVSNQLLQPEIDKLPEHFYIDFRNAEGRMPVVSMAQLENGGLVSTLIAGKVVLIGYVDPYSPDLLTPIGNISFPMFQAYALDTLLNASEVKYLGLLPMMLLIMVIVAAIFVLIPKVSDRFQALAFSIILLVTLLVSWLLLMNFNYG